MKFVIIILLSFSFIGCGDDGSGSPDPGSYESLEALMPMGAMSQREKDNWRPYKVAFDAMEENVFFREEFDEGMIDDGDEFESSDLTSPDLSVCEFQRTNVIDTDEQRSVTVNVASNPCPISISYFSNFQFNVGSTQATSLYEKNYDLSFVSAEGWPPAFDVKRVVYQTRTTALITVDAISGGGTGSFTVESFSTTVPVTVRFAGKIAGNPNDEQISSDTVIIVEGEDFAFGGRLIDTGGSTAYFINNAEVSKEQWEQIFGAIE